MRPFVWTGKGLAKDVFTSFFLVEKNVSILIDNQGINVYYLQYGCLIPASSDDHCTNTIDHHYDFWLLLCNDH